MNRISLRYRAFIILMVIASIVSTVFLVLMTDYESQNSTIYKVLESDNSPEVNEKGQVTDVNSSQTSDDVKNTLGMEEFQKKIEAEQNKPYDFSHIQCSDEETHRANGYRLALVFDEYKVKNPGKRIGSFYILEALEISSSTSNDIFSEKKFKEVLVAPTCFAYKVVSTNKHYVIYMAPQENNKKQPEKYEWVKIYNSSDPIDQRILNGLVLDERIGFKKN